MHGKSLWRTALLLLLISALTAFGTMAFAAGEDSTTGSAVEEECIIITTAQELAAIRENPAGDYKLASDIDMAGQPWEPFEFKGTLDGQGHSLLNLTIKTVGEETAVTYDGNMKPYDTHFAAFFSVLDGATVKNLNLINIRVDVNTDDHCFASTMAGYMEAATVENCNISGRVDIQTTAKMFGAGGIAGYGNGVLRGCAADVTLVCIDNNVEEKDEQFMGGAYAAGYIDLADNNVTIEGFDSDHGYVHNGGLVGMYILYPAGTEHSGFVTGNNIAGQITFFEDNRDRRAYCKAYIGEIMNWTFTMENNTENFTRDERKTYNVNLLPEGCAEPVYSEEVVAATFEDYGFTMFTCRNCGYSYKDNYVPKLVMAESVDFDSDGVTLKVGDSWALLPILSPVGAVAETEEWSSSDEDVVKVDEKGNIEAVGTGKATLTYSIDGGRIVATYPVTVKNTAVVMAMAGGLILVALFVLIIRRRKK